MLLFLLHSWHLSYPPHCTANFKIEQPPAIIFEDKCGVTGLPGTITPSNSEDENYCSLNNVEQNVSASKTASKDIAELHIQGIMVEDDSEPAPENGWAPPPTQLNDGEWINPSIRHCQANDTISDKEGK